MKNVKSTIISGGPASGKSWIAEAIANQYEKEAVKPFNSEWLLDKIHGDTIYFLNELNLKYGLIVIDECMAADIIEIENTIKKDIRCAIVYLTQDDVKMKGNVKYHVINCNNNHE